jgi:hypothetical protein
MLNPGISFANIIPYFNLTQMEVVVFNDYLTMALVPQFDHRSVGTVLDGAKQSWLADLLWTDEGETWRPLPPLNEEL